MNSKNYLMRFRNTGTLLAIASCVILLLSAAGININSEKVIDIVRALCAVGLVLGILNNPDSPGIDIPYTKK